MCSNSRIVSSLGNRTLTSSAQLHTCVICACVYIRHLVIRILTPPFAHAHMLTSFAQSDGQLLNLFDQWSGQQVQLISDCSPARRSVQLLRKTYA